MKAASTLFLAFFYMLAGAQTLVTNNGLSLTIQSGLTVTIPGGYTNKTSGSLGTIANSGTITLTGDWTNNSANSVFSTNAGTVQLIGTTAPQTIGGSNGTGFYNLTTNNTFATAPQFTLGTNTQVKNVFTMTLGFINMASNSLTIGLSAANPGSLSHSGTSGTGWLYGGSIIRYFNNVTVADRSLAGLYPLGNGTTDFRPIYLSAPSVAPTTGGTITVSHTASTTTSTVSFPEGGDLVERRQDSFWAFSAGGGLTGGTYNISAEGTGFGTIQEVGDLRITLAGSAVGTSGTNAGTTDNPQVNVTGLSSSDLNNSFYIASVDAANTPLPIELISFGGAFINNQVVFHWSTASEKNNHYFSLERSVNQVDFEVMAKIEGAGNSSSILRYRSIDPNPFAGIAYYRLRQTDFDGKSTTSKLIQVNAGDRFKELNVFPNPSEGKIQLAGVDTNSWVHISTIRGELIVDSKIEEGTVSDLSHYPSGVYFLTVYTENRTYTRKIVLSH